MTNLSVSLTNLLKSLNYQYSVVSNNNTDNKKSSNTNSSNANSSNAASSNTTSSSNTSNTAGKSTINIGSTVSASGSSSLSRLLNSLNKATSVLNNTSVITNDMVTEFFKSYKNSTMTSIYNKLQNGSSMTDADLANFQAQVAKLSADEKKLWKTEISKIENQISSKITKTTPAANTTLNGVVSGVLYKNGSKYSGVYTDGKYYQNGVLASGTVNGKYYNNGVLANGTINGKTYENGVIVNTPSSSGSNTSSSNMTVTRRETNSNGHILGYNSSGKLVYLEKTVNGQKIVYTDELNYISAKTKSYLTSVKDSVLSDRLLSDIQIVKNAEAAGLKAGDKNSSAYQNAYNASVKSQMIKSYSTGEAGEVVEQNGSLYVNDGNKMVKLNISADTYLKLFAPVQRYDINQNSIGDCYFVSGCLTDMMKNGKSYAQVLQMFSENSNGDITVKFSGSLGSYPVTFENGQLKVMDGKVGATTVKKYTNASGSVGTKMLEQAYAIANFASENKRAVSSIDIDETLSSIEGGWQYKVYGEVLGNKTERKEVDASSVASYLNSVASKVNNNQMLLSFANYTTNSQYSLINAHAYSIEKIDTAKQVVYVTNPWFSGGAIAVPYSEFAKVAYSVNNKIYFNVGYFNS